MNFVPCLTWIKRGVAKSVPDKVQLSKEELQNLIQEARSDLKNLEDDVEDECDENAKAICDTELIEGEPEDIQSKYNLDDYDDDDNESYGIGSLAHFTKFASNDEDPYLTVKDEEDNSEDEDDFNIKPSDNLIAVGRVEENYSSLEVHVYNEENGNFYVHHDIVLPAYPLVMEWMDYDPMERKGNFLAVGDMTPVIRIWDLDIVDTLEAVVKLGSKKKKKKVKDSSGHNDAVLTLSWNQTVRHVLASGSADTSVILWDLSQSKPVTKLEHHNEKVQSLKWHPCEGEIILTGGGDQVVSLCDCRTPGEQKIWNVDGEVEKVLWNHFDPFYFLVGTSNGFVVCFDARSDKSIFTLKAHNKSVSDIAISSACNGCLVTVSDDKTVKIWDMANNQPSLVSENNPNLGDLFTLSSCPDCPFVFAMGGDNRADNLKVLDIRTNKSVRNRFSDRIVIENETNDLSEMETEATTSGLEKLSIESTSNQAAEGKASGSKTTLPKPQKKFKHKKKK